MILPTKYIDQDEALIGVGATLLKHLREPITVSGLWERTRGASNVGNFERFVLAANLLFVLGAIDLREGLIVKLRS
jgi:hypothetical protein